MADPITPQDDAVKTLVAPNPLMSMRPAAPDYRGLEKSAKEVSESQLKLEQEKARYFKEKIEPLTQKNLQQKEKRIEETNKLLEESKPYPKPTPENFELFATTFSILSALTFAVGGKGRGAGMSAMSALNGALDGYNKGRKDLYDKNMKDFEKQIKLYEINSKQILEKLKEANKLGDERTVAGREALAEAMLLDQGAASAYLKANNKKAAFDIMERNVAQAEKLNNTFAMQIFKNVADLAKATGGSKAFIYQTTGKVVKDDKTADQINDITGALHDVTRLRDRLKDPDIQTGVFARPQQLLQNIRSAFEPFQNQNIDESTFNRVLNQEFSKLDPNDKSVLFIKDAMISAFKIEQGLVGTRVPVFTQRVLGPVLDPRQYTAQAYDNLLRQRQEDLYNVAARKNFTRDEIDRMSNFFPFSTTTTPVVATQSIDVKKEREIAEKAIASGKDEAAVKQRFKQRTGQDY